MEKNNKIAKKNKLLEQIIQYSAYIITIVSVILIVIFSLPETIKLQLKKNWESITVVTIITIFLSYLNWSTWYKRQYDIVMQKDIVNGNMKKYSIHTRYYMATKDWTDSELQVAIERFNDNYERNWLKWVEKRTGRPINTKEELVLNNKGEPIVEEEYTLLDDDGDPILDIEFQPIKVTKYKTIITKGIKDLPYKGFKHKGLMRRIKNHNYPQSGYKNSMEILSLFSITDSSMIKRNLKADKKYYISNAITKSVFLLLSVALGVSVIPGEDQFGTGYWWVTLVFKIVISVSSLLISAMMGAMNGVKGAHLKLSVVENVCSDLEHWSNSKPVLEPYSIPDEKDQLGRSDAEENKEDLSDLSIFERVKLRNSK